MNTISDSPYLVYDLIKIRYPIYDLAPKVVYTKKYGDVHEKFHVLKNTRFKTLEHLLKTF